MMRCPDCLSNNKLVAIPSVIPAFLFPLRLFVRCVQCDCCLQCFYQVRLFGWKIRSTPPDDPYS